MRIVHNCTISHWRFYDKSFFTITEEFYYLSEVDLFQTNKSKIYRISKKNSVC